MRLRNVLSAAKAMLSAVLIAATLGTAVVHADVFHGHWIRGPISEAYIRLGGFPIWGNATSDEVARARGGLSQDFQADASIYWNPNVAGGVARQVGGLIRQKWVANGAENGYLGYPTTDETALPHRFGRFNHFEGGSIYWSPESGVFPISGPIRDFWSAQGWENSRFGMPTSDMEIDAFDVSVVQRFENGEIRMAPRTLQQLPVSDNKPHSSYRLLIPAFPVEYTAGSTTVHLGPEGLNQHVKRMFNTLFPLGGCPNRITQGVTCQFESIGGVKESVTVSHLADDGFALETTENSPEGAGRTTVFTFTEISSRESDENMVFPNPATEILFHTLEPERKWVALKVESFGPISDAQFAGPFNNRRIGTTVWSRMSGNILSEVENMQTVYLVEGIESMAGLRSESQNYLAPFRRQQRDINGHRPEPLLQKDEDGFLPLEECGSNGCEVDS